MRLSRVYDDNGHPTDERIDTITGESEYDHHERWHCRGCGAVMYGMGWVVHGHAGFCMTCWEEEQT